jgi:hypothetical protein
VPRRPVRAGLRAGRGDAASVVALLTLIALCGCSAPTLDPDELAASSKRVRDSVEEERRVAFDESLQAVQQASRGEVPGTAPFSLAGMNADAVFAEAERIAIRRDIAWFEEVERYNQEVLNAAVRLARVEVVDTAVDDLADNRVRLTLSVRNGLDGAVGAGWLTTEVRRGDGGTATSLDYVVFDPPVEPGAGGRSQFVVSGDAARFLSAATREQLSFGFSTVERRGKTVLEAATPEMEAKARAGVESAKARLAELKKRLAAAG